jgi:DNA repair exonuclease SbcCD nuclease subunit
MQPFRFVHAADLHLDAPFRGLSLGSGEVGSRLRQTIFSAFDTLVELCLSKQADFLLVAGDVYNHEVRSLRAQLHFRDGLARLAENGLTVFVVHGNHDPTGTAAKTVQWPDGVRVFEGDEPECAPVVRNGSNLALVHGASHVSSRETRNLARRFRRDPQDLFQIGLLHCNLGRNTGHEPYAPCSLDDLAAAGLDYWALGHVHSGGVWSEDPYAVYSGNIQGLNITESGPKGCYLVDVHSDHSLTLSFQVLDGVRWSSVEADIAGISSLDGLEEAVLAAVEAEREAAGDRGLICRVVLCGRGPLHGSLSSDESQDELLQRLREQYAATEPFVWIKDLRVQTGPDIDLEAIRRRQDLLGEVFGQTEALKWRQDRLDLLQREILSDLFGHRRAKKFLSGLSQQEADELIRQAEYLLADRLESEEGS